MPKRNNMGFLRNIITLFTFYFLMDVHGSDVLKSNGTAASDLNAEMLVKLGRKLNKPLITIIGKVMENYHLCTDWSEWTDCGAMTVNYFATKSRKRHCALLPSSTGDSIPEIETSVCEGKCPPQYNLTTNKYCFKFHSTPQNFDEAEEICKGDGGFLINIDNDMKYADVKEMLIVNDEKENLHIDGRRINSTSPWKYSYGSENGYFHWYPGYPQADDKKLCLMLTGHRTVVNQQFLSFNYLCTSKYPFICEVQT